MLVCHCNVVSDREISAAIAAGATDVGEVAARCGAGAGCTGCVPMVERLLAEAALAITEPAALQERQRARRVGAGVGSAA